MSSINKFGKSKVPSQFVPFNEGYGMIVFYLKVERASLTIRAREEVCSETMTCLTTVHAVGQRWCASGEVNSNL